MAHFTTRHSVFRCLDVPTLMGRPEMLAKWSGVQLPFNVFDERGEM